MVPLGNGKIRIEGGRLIVPLAMIATPLITVTLTLLGLKYVGPIHTQGEPPNGVAHRVVDVVVAEAITGLKKETAGLRNDIDGFRSDLDKQNTKWMNLIERIAKMEGRQGDRS